MMENALCEKTESGKLLQIAARPLKVNPFRNPEALAKLPIGPVMIEVYLIGGPQWHRDPKDAQRLSDRKANLPDDAIIAEDEEAVAVALVGPW